LGLEWVYWKSDMRDILAGMAVIVMGSGLRVKLYCGRRFGARTRSGTFLTVSQRH